MIPKQQDTIQTEITRWTRRLRLLKEKKAQLGFSSDPSLIIEIEDIEAQLKELYSQLEQAQNARENRSIEKTFPSPVFHNLPQPDYERFVGRKAELRKIFQLLSPKHRSWVITIDGVGGVGKSALALEVATRYSHESEKLPSEERFDAIIWTTAKQSVLTGEGIMTRTQPFHTLEDIFIQIGVTLKSEDITRAKFDKQESLVRQALTQQRTLLIIDNLETVDDERVMTFIREVPAPTKVIVTTRHRIDVAYPARIVGMDETEGLELIADETQRKGVSMTDNEAKQLYKRAGGVPLAIVWSIAQMSFGYEVEAVLNRLSQPSSDISRFCFDAAIERIRGKSSHKLLMALSLFAKDASREALGYIANLPVLDRDEGLVELEKLSLVNKSGKRFQLLPLTLAYSQAELAQDIELKNLYTGRWIEYLLNFLIQESKMEYKSLEDINAEMDNILSAMEWCWRTNQSESFLAFVDKISFYLRATDKWSSWNKYLELALRIETSQADFLVWLASMRFFQDDLDESQEYIEKAIKIYHLRNDVKGLSLALWRLGSIQIERENYEMASKNLNEALKLAEQVQDKRVIVRIERRLAMIDMAKGDYNSAEIRLKESRDLREQDTEVSSGLATTYRLLGKVAFLKSEYDLARQYYEKTLEIGIKLRSPQNIAQVKQHIAELEFALGNFDKAKRTASEAIEGFSNLGMKRDLRETQILLEQIEAKMNTLS